MFVSEFAAWVWDVLERLGVVAPQPRVARVPVRVGHPGRRRTRSLRH